VGIRWAVRVARFPRAEEVEFLRDLEEAAQGAVVEGVRQVQVAALTPLRRVEVEALRGLVVVEFLPVVEPAGDWVAPAGVVLCRQVEVATQGSLVPPEDRRVVVPLADRR